MHTDLSLSALALANEANWREGFCKLLDNWERSEVHVLPDLVWFRSDQPDPILNSVLTFRFGPVEAEGMITWLLERFRERGSSCWWWLFDSTRPADLGSRLVRHGFRHEEDLPGMAAPLAEVPAAYTLADGVTVERVESEEQLAGWADAYEAGFPVSRGVAAAHYQLFDRFGFGDDHGWRLYLGLLHGRPVATSAVYLGAGVAGLYYVSTRPEARSLGIGRAMVVQPLLEARALGYQAAILQATSMGRPLYEKLGFRECVRFPQYRWNPEPKQE